MESVCAESSGGRSRAAVLGRRAPADRAGKLASGEHSAPDSRGGVEAIPGVLEEAPSLAQDLCRAVSGVLGKAARQEDTPGTDHDGDRRRGETERAEDASEATVDRSIQALKAFFNWLIDHDLAAINPCAPSADVPSEQRGRPIPDARSIRRTDQSGGERHRPTSVL